jgi:hypothetical protein
MTPSDPNPERDRDAATERLAARLESERPVPRAGFRADLRRQLLTPATRRDETLRAVRLRVAAYAASGFVLLGVAAIGVAGAGPFAA